MLCLFEKGEMGGDCLNYGCVPSKALITVARRAQEMRELSSLGLSLGANQTNVQVDWEQVKAHVQGAIDTIAPVDSQERFEGMGVTVVREPAHFADRRTVASESVVARPKRIVIATGSRAVAPPIPGLDNVPYLTNETIFSLPVFPEHLVVLGGGPIGVELGQCFARLGAKVTLVERASIMARSEPEYVELVRRRLIDEGVTLMEDTNVTSIEQDGDGKTLIHIASADGRVGTVTGSHLLVAAGRAPVLEGLALEAGGVDHDRRGVIVRDNLRSASNARVWAVGDVAGRGQFTHLAGWHASVFVRNGAVQVQGKSDGLPLPAVTYCEPKLARLA